MQYYEPRVMLVTGGAGFIGANFIRYALSADANTTIINLDKLTYAASPDHLQDLPDDRYQFVRGDINDVSLVKKLLATHQINTIVHFAAESHVDRSIASPEDFVVTNVMGTYHLLEAARQQWLYEAGYDDRTCRFHHISTDEVYGSLNNGDTPFNEQSRYQPRSPYSASKAASDHFVLAYHHTYGLPVTVSHCSNNYGPYQHQEKFIPTVIRSCLQQQPIPIYGQGRNKRDWLHVLDHCRGIMSILQRGEVGRCYDLGGDNEWENITLAKLICEIMDEYRPHQKPYADLITHVTDRQGHDFRYAIDASHIKSSLGWTPQVDFMEGLRATVSYYLEILSKTPLETAKEL